MVRPMVAITPLLKREEAAEALNQSIRKVDLEIACGNLKAVRIGRSVRIRREALNQYIEARESRVKVKVNRAKKSTGGAH